MCHGGGDSRGLVRHPADLVPWGLPPGGGLCGRPPAIGCGWRSALDVRVAFSVEGLLTTGICPLACAGLTTILTMRFGGCTGSSATGVRDFAIIGIASMAAVSVPAAPAFTRRKNACKASSTHLRVATARLRCSPAHTGSSWRTSVSSRHWLGKVIDRRAMRRAVPGRRRCKAGNDLQAGGGRRGEMDAKLVRARSVILLHAASTYPRRLLLKSPGLHPWRRHHRR